MTRLTIVGDVLLDRDVDGRIERLAPDAPVPVVDEEQVVTRPGGAGLAAVLTAQDGHDVTLVTATGDDAAGEEVRRLLAEAGVEVIDLGTDAPTPEKIRLAPGGRPVARLDRGGRERGRVGALPPAAARALAAGDGVLVSDYGRGVTVAAEVRDALEVAARDVPLVWDPHPRGEPPTAHARLATPNRAEARRFARAAAATGEDLRAVASRAEDLVDRWPVAGVVVTMGAGGALLLDGGSHPLVVPAPAVRDGDACGAGDRFAVSVAAALADGQVPSRAVGAAVHAAAAFVAAGGARSVRVPAPRDPAPDHEPTDAVRLADAVRGRGGTVVATGGCFDLLHAGHVATLQSARSLGDCLVVCLNSDASVRRLKGPDRPINDQEDRAAVLRALGCVDAIAIFDEDTPSEVLRELRPHLWAKGGDYAVAELPEAEVVEAWGGQAVVLPYVEGRSTSRLLEEVRRDAR